jgi:hypothetical protein
MSGTLDISGGPAAGPSTGLLTKNVGIFRGAWTTRRNAMVLFHRNEARA